jgi:hypothetical protein
MSAVVNAKVHQLDHCIKRILAMDRPNLRCVRLVNMGPEFVEDPSPVRGKLARKWSEWILKCCFKGIRLEDGSGRRIRIALTWDFDECDEDDEFTWKMWDPEGVDMQHFALRMDIKLTHEEYMVRSPDFYIFEFG